MMWSTRTSRNAQRTAANRRRYIPRLEQCEDRLPPGQVFALFADPFAAPFGAVADVTQPDQEARPALVGEPEAPPTGRPTPARPGLALPGGAGQGQVVETPGTPSAVAATAAQPAAAPEFLTQIVMSLAGADLAPDPVSQAAQVTLTGTVRVIPQ